MVLALPLGEDKVMLFEVFFQQTLILPWLYHGLAVLIHGRLAEQIPPPAAAFEELVDQLGVVTPTDESLVMSEILTLKV